MANYYTYPHVNFTTKTTARRVPEVLESTATKLLAPFTSDRGPENQLVAIDSYADFVATFGLLDYSNPDQRQLLNIGAWLANGGRVMACRLSDVDDTNGVAKKASGTTNLVLTTNNNKTYYTVTENDITNGISVSVDAKYSGTFYNDIEVQFIRTTAGNFKVNVTSGNVILESFSNRSITKIEEIENLSQYIENIRVTKKEQEDTYVAADSFDESETYYVLNDDTYELVSNPNSSDVENYYVKVPATISDITKVDAEKMTESFTVELSGGTNVSNYFIDPAQNPNYVAVENEASTLYVMLKEILKQPLVTPVDCIIDCGYSELVKKDLQKLCCVGTQVTTNARDGSEIKVTEKRDDIFLFLSAYTIKGNGKRKDNSLISQIEDETAYVKESDDYFNSSIIDYFGKTQDIYSEDGGEVYVPASYLYASLIPYNDAVYGPHKSTAGLTRGVVTKLLSNQWVNEVPSNKEKQEHWNNQVNYLEKDSRGLYIMSDLTCNKSNNILDRMYAARTLIKIKKDLELIGRRVLHEYNDSLVQARLMAECDAYLSTWLQNGALSSAYVDIIDYTRRPSLSDTELVVAINVKFKNTIDVVPFEITL